MGVHKSRTIAYHPECDGLVERQNRTLQEMLASFVFSHKDDWDIWLSLVVYAPNTSCHESTGYSPFKIVFGRLPRTPLELDLDIPLKNPCSQSEYVVSLRKSLKDIKQSAQKHLAHPFLNSGNPLPLMAQSGCAALKSGNLGECWIGPYKVLSRNRVNYEIVSKEGKELVVHHDNLKLCVVPITKGIPTRPVPEIGDINIIHGDLVAPQEG